MKHFISAATSRCLLTAASSIKLLKEQQTAVAVSSYRSIMAASSSKEVASNNSDASSKRFSGTSDRFKCITIRSEGDEVSGFKKRLEHSLTMWKQEKVRGIWFHVEPQHSDCISALVSKGFVFHHANADRLALYLWLDEKDPCNIPSYAHTLIGVGGMVINDRDEILVVQERFFVTPHWKLPGGYVDPGEHIHQAAVREVLEETGIQTEFRSIVAFRHAHKFNFGCSDIYIIVLLKPVSDDIKSCSQEISRCRWMPVKEYATHELVHDTNRHFINKYIESKEKGTTIGLTELDLKIADRVFHQNIYSLQFEK